MRFSGGPNCRARKRSSASSKPSMSTGGAGSRPSHRSDRGVGTTARPLRFPTARLTGRNAASTKTAISDCGRYSIPPGLRACGASSRPSAPTAGPWHSLSSSTISGPLPVRPGLPRSSARRWAKPIFRTPSSGRIGCRANGASPAGARTRITGMSATRSSPCGSRCRMPPSRTAACSCCLAHRRARFRWPRRNAATCRRRFFGARCRT